VDRVVQRVPLVVGFGLALIDLFVLYGGKRNSRTDCAAILSPTVAFVVALTAYHDEAKPCRRDEPAVAASEPTLNLEFNAHFLDVALDQDCGIVECPITFDTRVGVSKGGNVNNLRAMKRGLRMLVGIVLVWRMVEA
jgi:hypothetical protein